MFDFLKGGKATVTVTLDRPTHTYYLGETMQATIEIQGQKDLKVMEARTQLVCREEYQYRYEGSSIGSDGDAETSTEKRWATDEQVIQQQQLLPEGTIPSGFNQTFDFIASIPVDAPATCESAKIVRVKWLLKAALVRRLASDIEATIPIQVLSAPVGSTDGTGEYGFSDEPDEAALSLELPSLEWCLGDTVQGRLLVRPQKVFDVSEVRVELTRKEFVPRDEGNLFRETKAVKLAGRTRLQPGQEMVFPFSIVVPTTAPITVRTRNSSVSWSLVGVLARTLRRDTHAEQDIFIFSGRR